MDRFDKAFSDYARANGYDVQQVLGMPQSTSSQESYLLYHDPAKGTKGMHEDGVKHAMPIVLIARANGSTVTVEETENTAKYLRRA